MDISVLFQPRVDLPRIAEVLDGLGHDGRAHATRQWNKAQLAELFEAAADGSLTPEFLVPSSLEPLVPVIHDGHNSLPMFTSFQKRFARMSSPMDNGAVLCGYNHQSMSVFTGPGYFVVRQGSDEHAGALEFDYTTMPKEKPESWPSLSGSGIVAGPTYGSLIDYVRRVSNAVSIGRAWKHGKAIDNWFVLVRRDA